MPFEGGYSFTNFLADAFTIFLFIVWFWLLITVFGDLFRRRDISGWGKVIWVIVLFVVPYIGIFAYMISQGKGMTERSIERGERARDELRRVVGFSVADEIQKLDGLKKSGAITNEEYGRLRAKLIQ